MRASSPILASACVLLLLLATSVDLSFGQETGGNIPFFNDEGALTLPRESVEELEESMPELEVFRPSEPAFQSPSLQDLTLDQLGDPGEV